MAYMKMALYLRIEWLGYLLVRAWEEEEKKRDSVVVHDRHCSLQGFFYILDPDKWVMFPGISKVWIGSHSPKEAVRRRQCDGVGSVGQGIHSRIPRRW